jgi:diguanylate cyclase (GGDEF)-like protein
MKQPGFLYGALHGRVPAAFYRENRAELDAANLRTAQLACPAAFAVAVLMLGLSAFVPALAPMRWVYAVLAAAFGALAALVLRADRRRFRRGRAVLYLLAALADGAAILLGTVYSPGVPATAYFMINLLAAVLVLDRPVLPMVLTGASIAAFCAADAAVKGGTPAALQTDLANAACSWVLCVVFIAYLANIRLENLQAVRLFRARSETDRLTGLSNKAAAEQLCRMYLSPGRATACALLLLDVDDFKHINDTLGHVAGDEVLHSVGRTLRALFREKDIVGRFGGDEFLVLMKDLADPDAAVRKADLVRERLADILPGGRPLHCCIGIAAAYPGDGQSFEGMLSRADTALYASKNGGKNCCTAYAAEPEERHA